MEVSNLKSDSYPISAGEMRETLRQVLPALEQLILAARNFCGQNTAESTLSSCESCSERKTCSGQCKKLRNLVPKVNSGRNRRENLTGLHEATLNEIQETKLLDTFQQYEACEEIFTTKEWVAVYLRRHDGKKLSEIAEILNIGTGSVGDRLSSAEKKKEQYYRNLRAEKLEYLRKKWNEDNP
jgi:predicted DNA-binding protein YlxM (UPF0122 family)